MANNNPNRRNPKKRNNKIMAESKEHRELKERACQYLLNQNYRLARMEKNCGYYGIADAWGINFQSLDTKIIEVKISRADFLSDKYKKNKIGWHTPAEKVYYLCPSGLIQPEEVGESVGLLWFNGSRLINKKKAPFHKVLISIKLRILIDFLEVKIDLGRKMTLKK